MTSHVTTHVLDTVRGGPAPGIRVTLSGADGGTIASGVTDDDGRVAQLGPERLEPGVYRVSFATGEYFGRQDVRTFYPSVTIDFVVEEGEDHYHVPCLLSPFAYSTYRGS
ncbi:hydroxyisourate hydrolase [Georgenia alba]|uniref:5-hydroxyisourate hydrolase n=1 Tax=Georgenia alba TaxID=2233858 RepID=A0ABW2QC99_9MICO